MSAAMCDRISGAVVMAFALVLWFVIIPDQVDSADFGWMRPRTLPQILAVGLFILGAILFLAPARNGAETAPVPYLPLTLAIMLSGLGVFAMGQWGFVVVAPVLACAAALLVGERRWPWLLASGAVVPGAIWLLFTLALGRPLP